jgi:hypothetical protein
VTTILVCVVFVGSACTDQAVDDTKRTTGAALDATRKGADKAIDATKDAADKAKEIAGKTADKTREIAGGIAQKSRQVASATGKTVTDAWITTKVKGEVRRREVAGGQRHPPRHQRSRGHAGGDRALA